ncbi:ATP-dependent RNA helicase dbp10 [Fusarium falciforme]|nr:ATP-dependent RNA helicase dbp10 [Fusarium falciforme]
MALQRVTITTTYLFNLEYGRRAEKKRDLEDQDDNGSEEDDIAFDIANEIALNDSESDANDSDSEVEADYGPNDVQDVIEYSSDEEEGVNNKREG